MKCVQTDIEKRLKIIMKYKNTIIGEFIDRPNRFIAHVKVNEVTETVHVKNTGRCRELLIPGVQVVLEKSDNPARKTLYDLIAVYKASLGWVNIDSQVPNALVKEWLEGGNSFFKDIKYIKPEYTYGKSRVDFYLECGERKIFIEVKGCTLEIDGVGYFPDAPTERGVKHLKELQGAVKEGYECFIAFVIAMPGVSEVYANAAMHPEFDVELERAKENGVRVLNLKCEVKPDEIVII